MFWPDVIDLKLFYTSPLGRMAEGVIARAITRIWKPAQGALHWPVDGGKNLTFLADEADIPLPDESVSRVLLVHAVENSEQLRHMLREIWRVLAPNGRVLVVVPNRRGVWARMPFNPFAHGSPFTASQLRAVLRDHRLTPYESHYTLFTPPTTNEFLLKASRFFEFIGCRFFTVFSGIILMEAEKQIYAPSTQRAMRKKREPGYAPAPQPALSCDSR